MATPARNPLLFDQSGIELPLEFLLTFSIPKRPGETQEEYSQRFQKAKQARDELSERIHSQAHLNAGSELKMRSMPRGYVLRQRAPKSSLVPA